MEQPSRPKLEPGHVPNFLDGVALNLQRPHWYFLQVQGAGTAIKIELTTVCVFLVLPEALTHPVKSHRFANRLASADTCRLF